MSENNSGAKSAADTMGKTSQIPVVVPDGKDFVAPAKNVKLKTKKKMPKWIKVTVILALVAALALGGYGFYRMKNSDKKETTGSEYTVSKGDISVTISGSGSIAAIDQYDVTSLVKGEILTCSIEEGSEVKKGDVLYTIDSSDAQSSISKAQNSLTKAQMSYDTALKNIEKLSTKATIGGTVTQVYAKEGDMISSNGKVMDITDSTKMTLEVPFISTDANYIHTGDSANVTLEGSYYTVNGTVTRVASGSSVTSEGVEVRTVDISVSNPGAITAESKATAIVGGVACNSAGTFADNDVKTVYADASGEVTYQPFKVGDVVKRGEAVLAVSGDDASDSLKNARLSLSDAELTLQNAQEALDNYSIKAPISGKVMQKTSKAGDTLDNTNNTTTLCTIADLSKIVFEISVDELDISKISVGLDAKITADAVENRTFSGIVDYVSSIGTTSNGVTSYPVRIVVTDPDELIIGMNVDAEIVVQESKDVLTIPVNAVKRGGTVYRKKADGAAKTDSSNADTSKTNKPSEGANVPDAAAPQTAQNTQNTQNTDSASKTAANAGKKTAALNVPEGYEAVRVELGINDDTNIEVKSGLSEGDVIWVEQTAAAATQTTQQMPGMGGGMGGGMPPSGGGGGMPGGGGGMR